MFKIDIPIFDGKLLVCLRLEDWDSNYVREEVNKWFHSSTDKKRRKIYKVFKSAYKEVKDENALGITQRYSGMFVVVLEQYTHKAKDISILTHELLHVAIEHLRTIGMREGNDSTEAYTYLFDYLVEECMLELVKQGKENEAVQEI